MLILASTTDVVQLVTGSAGLIDVHASWMDNVSGAVAPGRTNTAGIATATTTTIVPAPVVNVQRNVKSLHIRNSGGSSQTVGVLIGNGTPMVKLWEQKLEAGGTLQYIDEIGFIRTVSPAAPIVFQKFVTAGIATYTPTPGMLAAIVEMVGGGAGGGDAAAAPPHLLGGGGGGSGSYSRKLVLAADIGTSKFVVVGAGGSPGRTGGNGGPTWLGPSSTDNTTAICLANGGIGGGGTLEGDVTPVGGDGGAVGVGDIAARGNSGEQGNYVLLTPGSGVVMGSGGRGGSSFFGGGAPLPAVGTSGSVPGIAGRPYGGGGSGAISNQTGGFIGSGPGYQGACFITEFMGF